MEKTNAPENSPSGNPRSGPGIDLSAYGWLSVAAAIAAFGLKTAAWWITDSVGMLSDALESLVNLAAGLLAVFALRLAARPPDSGHHYGHDKVEFFSGGIEGVLILCAAAVIAFTAAPRLFEAHPLEQLGLGLALSMIASAINFGVARVLIRAGREHRSMTLEADGQHLMTDVWTSAGVIAGLAAVALTGWNILDPLIAIAVAANIAWIGVGLMRRAVHGLMDIALPAGDLDKVQVVLDSCKPRGAQFHALRTRHAGRRGFVSVHVPVPAQWSVAEGHSLASEVEQRIREALPHSTAFTHLEPLGDPASDEDIDLDRAK